MAQTRVTCDVSKGGKVKADATTAMIRHWARDVDAANGIERAHSNESIDTSRSINNETYFPTDGPRDEWTTPGSTEEIEQRLQDRLATVTGRTRKDSVVMRGVVLGLSPEWVEEHTPNWKTDPADREKFMDALHPVVERVIEKAGGAKNVILVTGHFDETAPQIQMAVTPVTEDGRLRQNDFDLFKSPGSLRKLHKKIREELKESGLDVILESSERSREHLSNLEYARKADKEREKEKEALAKERQELEAEREQLERDKAALAERRRIARDEGFQEGYEAGEVEAGALYADVQQQRQEVEDERKQLDEDKAKLPELKRAAAKKGYAAGHKKGYGDGQEQVGTLLADARQKANDIVAQAHAQVDAIRKQREDLEKEKDKEKALLQETSDAVTAKYNELQQLRQEVEDAEAVKNSRENMKQLDSDFLDDILKYPKIHQRYEDFKKKRVKGFAAVVDGTQDYYERTVGENQQLQEQRAQTRQRQNQQQRGTQKPTQPGYKPMF
ncbi:plasmid recombination protein [Corynebacterium sp. HMSC077D03]|uniref:plasmid recombination protein n=1 Tax=Corynebacterium sp. HMSC077D03 TaxID=1739392 RepID=UPI0009F709B6|nr:plasmid recombination protein [Corynebacterium sp. HMSC077D03]